MWIFQDGYVHPGHMVNFDAVPRDHVPAKSRVGTELASATFGPEKMNATRIRLRGIFPTDGGKHDDSFSCRFGRGFCGDARAFSE